jgi:integrase
MPPRVYRGKSKYELRPRIGGCIKLCPLDVDRSTVWAAYHKAIAAPDPQSFDGLLTAYLASPQFGELVTHTKRAYERYAKQLRAVFGVMLSDDIEPADVRGWLDVRSTAKSGTLANREMALLGSVFRWGYERGKCARRPTIGVSRFREQARDRVVLPAELESFATHASPRLRAYLALRMATGLRQGELLSLPLRALTHDDGVLIEAPSKRGQRRLIEWSPALIAARDAVLALKPTARTYVWPSMSGGKLTQAGFQVEWQRTMRKFVEAGGERFHEHDLRAAAVEGLDLTHAQRLLGHQRSATTARHYRRTPEKVKPAK